MSIQTIFGNKKDDRQVPEIEVKVERCLNDRCTKNN